MFFCNAHSSVHGVQFMGFVLIIESKAPFVVVVVVVLLRSSASVASQNGNRTKRASAEDAIGAQARGTHRSWSSCAP